MPSFQNKWSKPPSPGLSQRINDAIKPKGSLKPRVEMAVKRLQAQVSKLDNMLTKLKQRDEQIFQRIVTATQQHDAHTSKVLSNELVEIRKVSRILGNARMALEQIELRLTTFHDLGDTVVTIMPTIGLMKSLKSSLVKFMPEADQEVNRMTEMLGGLMTDTFSSDATFGIEATTNAESDKILQEAAAVAETAVNEKFPSMPVEQASPSSSTTKYL
uniref:Putative Snf7 domain-containing protein n=1 Tax=uncultured organism TaxID=155900 RepID=A0A0F6PWZ9_9ZZZZ|nr:putative Snf7 domain-containing protein [uncultured organism]